jgi:hypothetical protein
MFLNLIINYRKVKVNHVLGLSEVVEIIDAAQDEMKLAT